MSPRPAATIITYVALDLRGGEQEEAAAGSSAGLEQTFDKLAAHFTR